MQFFPNPTAIGTVKPMPFEQFDRLAKLLLKQPQPIEGRRTVVYTPPVDRNTDYGTFEITYESPTEYLQYGASFRVNAEGIAENWTAEYLGPIKDVGYGCLCHLHKDYTAWVAA